MPSSAMSALATGLYGAGLSIDCVPPNPRYKRPLALNSLRLACPPKSSWLSRTMMRALLPTALR